MENNFDSFYPPKPFLEKEKQRKGQLPITVLSIAIFATTFLFFFGNQFRLVTEIIGVLLIHELGHFLFMKWYKYENVRMLFVPFMGAFVHGSKEKYQQRESIAVILAGPIPGIILGIAAFLLGDKLQVEWLVEVAILSFFLNIINLIPLIPLDGGRLFNVLFFQKMEWLQIGFTFISSLGIIAIGYFADMYVLILFGFLMGFQVRNMHRKYMIHKNLIVEGVNYTTTYEGLTDQSYHLIKREVLEHTPGLRKFMESADEEDISTIIANEVKNVLIVPMKEDANVIVKVITVFIWFVGIAGPMYLLSLYKLNVLGLFGI